MNATAVLWLVVLGVLGLVFWRLTRRVSADEERPVSHLGPGAVGVFYDMLNQDKRNAVEIIVEEKAGARDPEDADGNLPDLEDPARRRP
jgi:hypothetical protein